MELSWFTWAPLTKIGLNGVSSGPGVYRIRTDGGNLLYIGQSGTLAARLCSHARSDPWPAPACYSLVELPAGYTPTQLL
jgi:hypothetical protein